MSQIPDNVRQVLVQLLPASIINDIACYVFYDNHPRDNKNIDITICTRNGEVREYFQRDLLSSVNLESNETQTEIRILRNSRCELFYLLVGDDDLTILSRKDKLQIQNTLTNVCSYKISDTSCSGQAVLQVVHKYCQIPVIPDDNFENFKPLEFSPESSEELQGSIITHLMRKLMEAKYSVKCNENTLKDFVNIRQTVAFSIYKKLHPNLDVSVFQDGAKQIAAALKIQTRTPWIKACNGKIVIVYNVCNGNAQPLEDVHILLHGTNRQSIEYTTKIFENTTVPPFWNETKSQMLRTNIESALVVVIDMKELKHNIISKVEFNGVIIYKEMDKECYLPVHDVHISSVDTMGEEFDVLCSNPMDKNIMLAILATTEKTDLILRHIKRPDEQQLNLDIFCEYLQMEQVPHTDYIVVHRKSPYHVLNGVMIMLNSHKIDNTSSLQVTVFSRTPSQVIALIHLIHDAVPFRLVITTPAQKITAKHDMLSVYNDNEVDVSGPVYNYVNYASSILKRTGLVLEYLDNCLIHMNESKNPTVRNKIGTEIDLFAQGEACYNEFKKKMLEEASKGIKMLDDGNKLITLSDEMCVD